MPTPDEFWSDYGRPLDFWIQLTTSSGSGGSGTPLSDAYAWVEQVPLVDGGWVNGDKSGTRTTIPAVEVNGVNNLPSGLRVRAWPSPAGDAMLFQIGQAAGGSGGEEPCDLPSVKIVTNVCPVSGGTQVEYRMYDPCTGFVGPPFCVLNPTDCCPECSCGATAFVVHASGFTGPFSGWTCGVVGGFCFPGAGGSCAGPFPSVFCATFSGATGSLAPLNGVSQPLVWDPHAATGIAAWLGAQVALAGPPSGLHSFGTYWTCSGLCALDPSQIAAGDFFLAETSCAPFSASGAIGTIVGAPAGSATVTITAGGCGDNLNLPLGPTGFNGSLGLLWNGTTWELDCGGIVDASLDGNCLLTITYTAPSGDMAVYSVNVGSNCCGTFVANLVSTTSPGNVPGTITVQGIGCPGGGGSGGSGGSCSLTGTGQEKGTVTIPAGTQLAAGGSFPAVAGQLLIIVTACANTATTGGGDGGSGPGVKGIAVSGGETIHMIDVTSAGALLSTGPALQIWYGVIGVSGPHTPNFNMFSIDPGVIIAYQVITVAGLPNNALDLSNNNAAAGNNPSVPSTGPTAHACEWAQAAFLLDSLSGGASWVAPFTDGAQNVTFVANGVTYTLTEGYDSLAAAGSVSPHLTSTETRWAGGLATFD